MLTDAERRQRYAKIQELFRIRARNLHRLVDALGGFQNASRMTGKSIANLQQICLDEHPWHRTIGDTLARELEVLLRLQLGSLDTRGPNIRRDFPSRKTPTYKL